MNRMLSLVAAGVVCTGVLAGLMTQKIHADSPIPKHTMAIQPDTTVDAKLVEANTRFGFKLFQEVTKKDGNKNVFVSPTSIAIALSMTYNGANGETQQAMANALSLQGMSLPELNQANNTLKTSLENADPAVQMSIANSLWSKQGISFKPEFLQQNKQFYGAKVQELDFAKPESVKVINNWVNENTKGKIDSIVDQLKPDDVLFLINAIYFKGNWTKPFDKEQTTKRPFNLADGSQKQQPMMSQSGKYKYYENDLFQAVSLPYGKGRMSLYVFLPNKTTNLNSFEEQLHSEQWQKWMNQFQMRQGSVQLPRFKFDYNITLNKALKSLGMEKAFSPRADFSNMTSASVAINEVKHKTFLEVNEEGTEAAASTSVGMVLTSARMPAETPFKMVVDRPFFCAIRDNQTGTILFMGSIKEPK